MIIVLGIIIRCCRLGILERLEFVLAMAGCSFSVVRDITGDCLSL